PTVCLQRYTLTSTVVVDGEVRNAVLDIDNGPTQGLPSQPTLCTSTRHRIGFLDAPDWTPARVFSGALAPARYLMRNRCTMRVELRANDRNDPDWLGPSRVSLGRASHSVAAAPRRCHE